MAQITPVNTSCCPKSMGMHHLSVNPTKPVFAPGLGKEKHLGLISGAQSAKKSLSPNSRGLTQSTHPKICENRTKDRPGPAGSCSIYLMFTVALKEHMLSIFWFSPKHG
jgi:hypothetical protein